MAESAIAADRRQRLAALKASLPGGRFQGFGSGDADFAYTAQFAAESSAKRRLLPVGTVVTTAELPVEATQDTYAALIGGNHTVWQAAALKNNVITVADDTAKTAYQLTGTGAPGTPGTPTATGGSTQASVTWTAPALIGAGISQYTVTSTPGSKTATVDGSTLTATVTGLTNGTAYTFKVVASGVGNNADSSASAASNSVTPA